VNENKIYVKGLNDMLNLYLISIKLSCLSLILLLIRLFVNKNNLKIKDNKNKFILFISLLVISIIPIINIIFTISSVYISILMNNENFIKLMNE